MKANWTPGPVWTLWLIEESLHISNRTPATHPMFILLCKVVPALWGRVGSGGIDPRLLDLGTIWWWVVRFSARSLYPGNHWMQVWLDPRADLDHMDNWKCFALPELELQPLYHPVATPTALSRLCCIQNLFRSKHGFHSLSGTQHKHNSTCLWENSCIAISSLKTLRFQLQVTALSSAEFLGVLGISDQIAVNGTLLAGMYSRTHADYWKTNEVYVYGGLPLQQPAISRFGLNVLTFPKEGLCTHDVTALDGCMSSRSASFNLQTK
jgi:hypothetical protein